MSVPTSNGISDQSCNKEHCFPLGDTHSVESFDALKPCGRHEHLPRRWWFVSTILPLMAATVAGPLANVLAVAAIIAPWRVALLNNGKLPEGTDDKGIGIHDPDWEIILNACALLCGFGGNIFLLIKFTGRVRCMLTLPLAALQWFLAAGTLVAVTTSLHIYDPPVGPGQIYGQGFWYAVLASAMYILGGVMLLINVLGSVLGHYPHDLPLDDDQGALILQTMAFFGWLAGGATMYAKLEGWSFVDSLYWANVSFHTNGFGDMVPENNFGRGFFIVFELVGIVSLALVISSLSRFLSNISTYNATDRWPMEPGAAIRGGNAAAYEHCPGPPGRRGSDISLATTIAVDFPRESVGKLAVSDVGEMSATPFIEMRRPPKRSGKGLIRVMGLLRPLGRQARLRTRFSGGNPHHRGRKRQRKVMLRSENIHFDAACEFRNENQQHQPYCILGMSLLAFCVLWFTGALVFSYTENRLQHLTYFESLYFCFVSLLTVGYGDLSPKSNAGKPFFFLWSILAIPIITVVVQTSSNTIMASANRGTFALAKLTILPKRRLLEALFDNRSALRGNLARLAQVREQRLRQRPSHKPPPPLDTSGARFFPVHWANTPPPAGEHEHEHDYSLVRGLAAAICEVAHGVGADPSRPLSEADRARFARLVRAGDEAGPPDGAGLDGSLPADVGEAEWVLDRLCASLDRYIQRQEQRLVAAAATAAAGDCPEDVSETSGRASVSSSRTLVDSLAPAYPSSSPVAAPEPAYRGSGLRETGQGVWG